MSISEGSQKLPETDWLLGAKTRKTLLTKSSNFDPLLCFWAHKWIVGLLLLLLTTSFRSSRCELTLQGNSVLFSCLWFWFFFISGLELFSVFVQQNWVLFAFLKVWCFWSWKFSDFVSCGCGICRVTVDNGSSRKATLIKVSIWLNFLNYYPCKHFKRVALSSLNVCSLSVSVFGKFTGW